MAVKLPEDCAEKRKEKRKEERGYHRVCGVPVLCLQLQQIHIIR